MPVGLLDSVGLSALTTELTTYSGTTTRSCCCYSGGMIPLLTHRHLHNMPVGLLDSVGLSALTTELTTYSGTTTRSCCCYSGGMIPLLRTQWRRVRHPMTPRAVDPLAPMRKGSWIWRVTP